jgi:hypothetical protein
MALDPKQAFEYAVAFGENRANVAIALGEAAERGEDLTLREAQEHTDVSSTTVRNYLKALARDELVEETTKHGRMAFRMTGHGLQGFRAWRDAGGTIPARERRHEFEDRLASAIQEHVRAVRDETTHSPQDEIASGFAGDLPDTCREPLEAPDHDKYWSKVFALGARNGVEDLHSEGAFDDSQAPLLNRLTRRRIHEALLALRYMDPERPDDPFFAYLSELVDDWTEEDPYHAVFPGAVSRAVWEFAEDAGIDEATAEELEDAAIAGCLEHVRLLARANEPDATRQLQMVVAMVPSYWEDPDVSDEFRALLEEHGHRPSGPSA